MLNFMNPTFLPELFFIILIISLLSSLILLNRRIPINFVRIHTGILTLPPAAALFALIFNHQRVIFGPWRFDSLSWLLALFVLTIGVIVQRFSIHYLLGDRNYRKYFALLTLTTATDSLAWLSNDLRLLLICWGVTLLELTLLIRLKKEWQVARKAARYSGGLFGLSWFFMLFASLWIFNTTGHWQMSEILLKSSLARVGLWEKNGIGLLLIAAVAIPAAQWPFHRWLLDSAVAPTPVSAIMHAGIVNAGGILMTRFAPFYSGNPAQNVLLVFSSISVLLGTGIMLVHVDYKRQLVGSTIAQMGFMLLQCALGAYVAAIIHAILHGLFKSTLFLQAGSAARQHESIPCKEKKTSSLWSISGVMLGLMVGAGYYLNSPEEGYQLISALILGWSVIVAWMQLVANGTGRIGRVAGAALFTGAAIVYRIIHEAFYRLLHETVLTSSHSPSSGVAVYVLILLAGSALILYLAKHRPGDGFAIIYLWLVRLGEPRKHLVESHPKYLMQYLSRGGHLQ